jgi:flavin-binding protein dodecin
MLKNTVIYSLFLMLCLMALLSAQNNSGDVAIKIALDRNKIGLDEMATLSVTISAAAQQQLPPPKLPPLPMFEIYSAGTSTNLQIINGQMTYAQTTNYSLAPMKVGKFPIRSAWVLINGTRYESNELSIEVYGSSSEAAGEAADHGVDDQGKTRDLFLVAEVEKKNPYVDEQVTLTLKYCSAIQTIGTPDYVPPHTPGFWEGGNAAQRQYRQIINGREYFVIELKSALFPTKPGELTIDRAQITATVPERNRRRSRDPFSLFDDFFQTGRNITVRSQPITVNVRPLPLEGKTDEFSGGVGNYKISATVDKREAEVNEAIALTVKISGQGNIKSIPSPRLPNLPDFRVEESSSDYKTTDLDGILGGSKIFEYVLIPRLAGLQTIEPITLNYFDPQKRKYMTAASPEIALSIKQGELASGLEIPYNMVSGQTITLEETDIRYIKTEIDGLRPKGAILLKSPIFMVSAAIPLLALAGGMIDVRRRRRLESDVAYARLRRANAMAKKRLKKAETLLTGDNPKEYYAEISKVILEYIADKFNLSALGLTADKVNMLLYERGIETGFIEDTQDILQQADFGRFAGSSDTVEKRRELLENVREVFVTLEGAL